MRISSDDGRAGRQSIKSGSTVRIPIPGDLGPGRSEIVQSDVQVAGQLRRLVGSAMLASLFPVKIAY